uniref:Uncharacterized protein n=1 Tax=Arundo donax TaxID=35708 RepID=A0A0A9BMF0_ARUDO
MIRSVCHATRKIPSTYSKTVAHKEENQLRH